MRPVAIYAGWWLLIGLAFFLVPGIDLAASRLFYVPGVGFPLVGWAPLQFLEGTIPWITRLIVLIAVFGAAWLALTGWPLLRLNRKALVFIVAATALGPGLIANTVLKDNWGRARPFQTAEFGGTRQFTPAPLPAAQCERNCAFVSGHAALGFSLVSFALLLPFGRRRKIALTTALGFGALVGLGRIAVGHHFLSDVVYAGLIVFATSWLLYQGLVVRDPLGSAAVLRLYRAVTDRLAAAYRFAIGLCFYPTGRIALWTAAIILIEAVAILWIDRPLALFFYENAAWRPVAELTQRLGWGMPYIIGFSIGFIVLRWGGALPPLRRWAEPMRAAAMYPGFFLASVAVSGLIVDLLKVVFGRARPKLLFADGMYNFGWLGLGADFWSFPSGHAATAAALATALWCLWPRHVLFYIALAVLVAVSRVVTGAHYVSDVVMGAFVAVLVTRGIAVAFARFRWILPAGRQIVADPVLRLP